MTSRFSKLLIVIILAHSIALLAACDRSSGPVFMESEVVFTAQSATGLLESSGVSPLANTPSEEAADQRHRALTALRRQGGGAAEAAALITHTFPADLVGVPFRVIRATYEGVPAWLILESTGRNGATLSERRLWIVDDDGGVLFSAQR